MALEPLNCGLSHLDTLQTLADDTLQTLADDLQILYKHLPMTLYKHLPMTFLSCNFISHTICVSYFQQNKLFMHSARSGDSIARFKDGIETVYLDPCGEFLTQVLIHYMGQPKWWIFTTWVRFIIWVRTKSFISFCFYNWSNKVSNDFFVCIFYPKVSNHIKSDSIQN